MKELYTAPEMNILYMVARESMASNKVDFSELLEKATQEPAASVQYGDIDIDLPSI